MEFDLLGWPPEGPTLRLDHRQFAYAGKFVMSNTGKAVIREAVAEAESAASPPTNGSEYDTDILAALAFDADRTDESTLRYRYVTVRSDARGSELGPRLAALVAPKAAVRGYDRVVIAVNNPFAYEAMYKAGFEWTGEESGIAELVLERPATRATDSAWAPETETYRAGLDRFRERDLGEPEASFLAERVDADPPAPILVDGAGAESPASAQGSGGECPSSDDPDPAGLDPDDFDPADLSPDDFDPADLDPDG